MPDPGKPSGFRWYANQACARRHGPGSVLGYWRDATARFLGVPYAQGVVLVSIGYRLGIEGFLHLDDAPDNRGVLCPNRSGRPSESRKGAPWLSAQEPAVTLRSCQR
jgi:hypothetical protein